MVKSAKRGCLWDWSTPPRKLSAQFKMRHADAQHPSDRVDGDDASSDLFHALITAFSNTDAFRNVGTTSFAVYAHTNESGDFSEYSFTELAVQFINWLRISGTDTYSDKEPLSLLKPRRGGETAVSNIFANQSCLLPGLSRGLSVGTVDKVILFCSPLLRKYTETEFARTFTCQILATYQDCRNLPTEAMLNILEGLINWHQKNPEFHHVLTEIALLRVRVSKKKTHHGIIPLRLGGEMPHRIIPELKPTDLYITLEPTENAPHNVFFKLLKHLYPSLAWLVDIYARAYSEGLSKVQPKSQSANTLKRAADDVLETALTEVVSQRTAQVRALNMVAAQQNALVQAAKIAEEHKARQDDVLKSLHRLAYEDRKNRNSLKSRGTCAWLTGHPHFLRWRSDKSARLLFVTANPGCGKSVLARHLIDHELKQDTKATICYFFFKDDFEDQRDITVALSCVLYQLLISQPDLMDEDIITNFEQSSTSSRSFYFLWQVLLEATQNPRAGPVVCVLDALDECGSEGTKMLIDALGALERHSHNSNLKLLMTSRPYRDNVGQIRFLQGIDTSRTIHLEAETGSVADAIASEINLVIADRVKGLHNYSQEERAIVYEELTEKRSRTYLWVKLIFDIIHSMGDDFTKARLRSAIRKLPDTVFTAYEKILRRVEKHNEQRARRLLHIILAAKSPLTVGDMALALELQYEHEGARGVEQMPDRRFEVAVRSLCGLFVNVVDGKIYLLHQTAREFLLSRTHGPPDPQLRDVNMQRPWRYSISLVEANAILAEICMIRLSIGDFRLPRIDRADDSAFIYFSHQERLAQETMSRRPFLRYAIENWFKHAQEAGSMIEGPLLELACRCCSKYASESTWFQDNPVELPHGSSYTNTNRIDTSTGLIASSLFGLANVTRVLLQDTTVLASIHQKDYLNGFTAVHCAVLSGKLDTLDLLWEGGASLDEKSKSGYTPLHLAVTIKNADVVRWLLKHGAWPNTLNSHDLSPLMDACGKYADPDVFRALVDHQSMDIDFENDEGNNALAHIAKHCDKFLERLVLYDAVAQTAHSKSLEENILFECEIPPGRCQCCSYTRYVSTCEEIYIPRLLACEISVNRQNRRGETPLHWFARYGKLRLVETLIKGGADLASVTYRNRSVYHWARRWKADKVADYLRGEISARLTTTQEDKSPSPLLDDSLIY